MSLGTITVTPKVSTGPIHVHHLSFAGDGAYPAGGTVDLEGLFRAALKAAGLSAPALELLSIIQVDASGYVLRYDKANDKLMVFESDNGGTDGPLQESTTANLSGVTFKLIAFSL
jgi:hypothetical protein